MRSLCLFLLLLRPALSAEPPPPAVEWLTDLPAAQAKARDEHRLVLVCFNGSDWSPLGRLLQAEIFTRAPFQAFARERLVLVNIDFPREKPLDAETAARNAALASQYLVTTYPTVVLLVPSGGELGRTPYMQGGAKTFVRELQRLAQQTPGKPPL